MYFDHSFIAAHRFCAFSHYDFNLSGLLIYKTKYYFFKYFADSVARDQDGELYEHQIYTLHNFKMNKGYLEDYRKAYGHWFYENGKSIKGYEGEPLNWFKEKWPENPIENSIEKPLEYLNLYEG